VVVDYVVDMAEIPAFQERRRVDADGDGSVSAAESSAYRRRACADLGADLRLSIDGVPIDLAGRSSSLAFVDGQAGLPTLRLSCGFQAAIERADRHELRFDDGSYPGRLGWHEVVAVGDGTTVVRSDVPAESPSDRLRSYPPGARPLDVRSATVAFRPGGPVLRPATDGRSSVPGGDFLAGLAAKSDVSPALGAFMVLAAIGVGAVHALGPGHGKSLIGAYLVGRGGTMRQAVAVGAAVSVMHTASVLGLGVLVLSAERVLSPDRVYPWLGLASGLVALALGSALLVSRIHALAEARAHGHEHGHSVEPLSRRGLVALALSGGILPSPSALVVLLGSISIGRTLLGLVLIAGFSLGLAATLVGVGAVAIRSQRIAARRLPARLMRLTPIASASIIAVVGFALTARGIVGL
jgi:ABC-type nickel/cobalt efflux system permease component RcnA